MKELINPGVTFPEPFTTKGFSNIFGVDISLLAEEGLWKFYPKYFATTPSGKPKYLNNKLYLKNVWKDLKTFLPEELRNKSFPDDFVEIFNQMLSKDAELKEAKAKYEKEHKAEIEAEKLALKEKYGYVIKDGVKTAVTSHRVEGSRWFESKGELQGRWVRSVVPEDIEINASNIVPCPEGHHWKKMGLVPDVDYTATYNIDIGFGAGKATKSVRWGAASEEAQDNTEHKYEKARKLLLEIDAVEARIRQDMHSSDVLTRENALIAFVITTFGIRVGNDNKNSFRDKRVRGASTLDVQNMTLFTRVRKDEDTKEEAEYKAMYLDFIGKDSVLFQEELPIPEEAFVEFEKQLAGKSPTTPIYSKATSMTVNAYLKSIYSGEISPKLFRTCKGTGVLAEEFRKREWDNLTDKQFKNRVMECCLEVTKTLNHKRTVDPVKAKEIDAKADAKIAAAREKLKATREKIAQKLLKNKNDLAKARRNNNKEKVEELKAKKLELERKLDDAEQAFKDTKLTEEFKKIAKDANISTAINSYSSPRLSYSICKAAGKDPKALYSATQLAKFDWASDTAEDYYKQYPHVKETKKKK